MIDHKISSFAWSFEKDLESDPKFLAYSVNHKGVHYFSILTIDEQFAEKCQHYQKETIECISFDFFEHKFFAT